MDFVGIIWLLWFGVFYFIYVFNIGVVFSVFWGGVGWLKWFFFVVSVGLIIFVGKVFFCKLEQLGYGCILVGVVGNGIDCFLFGYVIDFLDFCLINFFIFNLVDVFINIGIVVLFWVSFFLVFFCKVD